MANSSSTVLVFSAGFGEGHNSAARSIVAALPEVSDGRVTGIKVDLFPEAVPRLEAFLKWGYGFVTTHLPRLWGMMYHMAEKDNGQGNLGWKWIGDLHRHMSQKLVTMRPGAVLSTFPMYPYLLAEQQWGIPLPKFCGTVITDSISINSVWTNAPTDRYFVTDEFSAELLATARGKAPSIVESTGFAVDPKYATLAPRPLEAVSDKGLRILYFATASQSQVKDTLYGLLNDTPPGTHITVSMGRHEARLGEMVRLMLSRHSHRSAIALGWTNRVANLLTEHDLIISKGGGATVHECFAAGTPVLANYFIPGQEEGNVELLKRRQCGWYFKEELTLGRRVTEIFQSGEWHKAKANMIRLRNPEGALKIARRTIELAGLI